MQWNALSRFFTDGAVVAIVAWVVSSAMLAYLFFYSFAALKDAKTYPGSCQREAIELPWVNIALSSMLVGLAVAIAIAWAWHCVDEPNKESRGWDLFFKGIVPFCALSFFAYQAVAGAFFATTSVSLDAKRDSDDPQKILVRVTLERGDNWLVDIVSVSYSLSSTELPGENLPAKSNAINFPCRPGKGLRLAPKEKTSTDFSFGQENVEDIFITVQVVSYALLWPIPSTSYVKALIPGKPACKADL